MGIFKKGELKECVALRHEIKELLGNGISHKEEIEIVKLLKEAVADGRLTRGMFDLNPILQALRTAKVCVEEISLKKEAVIATLLYIIKDDNENTSFSSLPQVNTILHGLRRISILYEKTPYIENENFRNLLLSFAEDLRVVLIMIADRVCLMRQLRDTANEEMRLRVSEEASYLYAPLAHKLGLYRLKSELEDLSLKYMEHDAYYMIRDNLNATKKSRDAYINKFIAPIDEILKKNGLKYHIKGRTKSIHSIWQKMKKQRCKFDDIYDLFAIRIILDSPPDKEYQQCWQTFALVTQIYEHSNTARLRDWLTRPKSNGYESLHITVLGPDNKWVEVQIRTERMDEVAEKGLAAHWRYKGVKSGDVNMEEWLKTIREALENNDDMALMDQFKMDLYDDEIFVFTPKGDLLRFPKGATILDFAYHIHSNIGNTCVGGTVNGRNVGLRQTLQSGDIVEVKTNSAQKPKQDWIGIVKSSRAKSKIRLALKETQKKNGLLAKELVERRFKNRKVSLEEGILYATVKKLGYKELSDFFRDVADERIDINDIIEKYIQVRDHLQNPNAIQQQARSAEEFTYDNPEEEKAKGSDDVLVIDKNLHGVDYGLARCCNPIYGDPIFGFVTVNGGIKVHRIDCPNAPELRRRFGYRVVKARWSGKGDTAYASTIRVVGNDDIGIINNITSIISKEEKIVIRSINIDSHDGLFNGNITVLLNDNKKLNQLIKKLSNVKGVKHAERL